MKTKKKIMLTCLIMLTIIIETVGFKILILDENMNVDYAKTVRKIEKEEEKKIFSIDEQEVNEEKIEKVTKEEEDITITKTIECGNNKDIYEGQVQTYYITVKNNTDEVIKDINIVDEIPEGLTYVEEESGKGFTSEYVENKQVKEYTYKIEKIEGKEELKLKYYVRVNKGEEIGKKVGTKAVATIVGNAKKYESELIENTIKESKLQIDIITPVKDEGYYRPDSNLVLFVRVKNISEGNIENVRLTYKVPEDAKYIQALYLAKDEEGYYEGEDSIKNNDYNDETREITWNFEKLEVGEEEGLKLVIKLENTTIDEEIVKIKSEIKAQIGEEENYSNIFVVEELNKARANIEMKVNPEKAVYYEGDELEYIVTVKLEQKEYSGDLSLKEILPNGLTGKSVEYYIEEGSESSVSFDEQIIIPFTLDEEETMTIKILVEVDKLEKNIETKEIKNQVSLSGSNIIAELSNEVSIKVNKKKSENNGQQGNDNNNNNTQENNNNNTQENNNGNSSNSSNNNSQGTNNSKENKNKFDFKIEKFVDKITVKDNKGTYQYEYEKADLAKVDLDRKNITNTNIVVEYKIVVTNIGTQSGYIKKIIDNVPKELEFKSELNKNWYKTGENLENIELENEIIQAGESKELKLILTKNITQNDIKTVKNIVNIGQSISERGQNDENLENNKSEADLIISIKTGKTIEFIILIIVLTTIMGIGIYIINKKVL